MPTKSPTDSCPIGIPASPSRRGPLPASPLLDSFSSTFFLCALFLACSLASFSSFRSLCGFLAAAFFFLWLTPILLLVLLSRFSCAFGAEVAAVFAIVLVMANSATPCKPLVSIWDRGRLFLASRLFFRASRFCWVTVLAALGSPGWGLCWLPWLECPVNC
jgi:hypothetical protein